MIIQNILKTKILGFHRIPSDCENSGAHLFSDDAMAALGWLLSSQEAKSLGRHPSQQDCFQQQILNRVKY